MSDADLCIAIEQGRIESTVKENFAQFARSKRAMMDLLCFGKLLNLLILPLNVVSEESLLPLTLSPFEF